MNTNTWNTPAQTLAAKVFRAANEAVEAATSYDEKVEAIAKRDLAMDAMKKAYSDANAN
jgi:hypothetical protein